MGIKWLVQDTSRSIYAVNDEVNALNKLGYSFSTFGILPFTNTITGLDDIDKNSTFIIRGGTKIVNILEYGTADNISNELLLKLKNGISHIDKMFDQAYYSTLNLPLLNSNSEVLNIKDNLNLSFSTDKFVKPSLDMKAFNAGIMEAGTVLKYYIESGYYRENYINEKVLIHDCIHIHGEYRFICLYDKVITGSRYQQEGRLTINTDIPQKILDCANEYVKLYHPADIFTMDLCETDNGIKIVEYNCWNGSGLYAMNIELLFSTIQDYYKNKVQ